MSAAGGNPRVLYVEDEVTLSLYGSLVLEGAGFAVTVAPDGEKGLELAKSLRPEAILTDFMMPRLDGIAMLRTLRAEGYTMPAAVISAVPRAQLPSGKKEPFEAYLPKPWNEAIVIETLEALLSHDGGDARKTG